MPKSEETKALTKENILYAAGRGFRTGGYGGIGVDGISKAAGVTSGAFYAHFGSKANAFEKALVYGMGCVREKIEGLQAQYGAQWTPHFIDYYFTDQLSSNLSEACALPSLSADVARANEKTQKAYEVELSKIAGAMANELPGKDDNDKLAKAWAILSILIGASSMVRAVQRQALADEIIKSAQAQALTIVS
ncbi:MAG: TetR family transcriptional regulator [Alphaproteobacteria bacterium]|nr:MAG: TetR family transcriptional regulator [Alphaproteobacteria bacterium]